ncbi:DUF6265 family protein [Sphingorhabdus contaminans]|nr:DUF6265 family protein [Sphingorhabdus contaminans]
MQMRIGLALVLLMLAPINSAIAEEAELPGWMTGAWAREDGDNWADEYWTPPRAGLMIGASRSGKGDTLQFWEHMRIVREADGSLVFWAISADQKPVRFAATRKSAEEIIFENAGHDYPQRIRYWREGKLLKAQISLIDGSKPVDFEYRMMGQ